MAQADPEADPRGRPWISLEQEESIPSWLGQPGGNSLGLRRHWHFFAVIFWVLNGLAYVVLLFATGHWRRLMNGQPRSIEHGAPLRLRPVGRHLS